MSPVTGPWPGTFTVTSLRSRQLGTFSTVTSPFSCSVVVTVPTGVSMRCSPGRMPPEMRQRRDHADRAVAAHPDVADVVEEDHAGGTGAVLRLDEQRADDHVRAARLVDDGGAVAVELAPEAFAARGKRPRAEVGAAGDDYPGRLAAGVRIDDGQTLHDCNSQFLMLNVE